MVAVCRQAIAAAGVPPTEIAAIGITNQRETSVLWERGTGSAVHRAIVWQDRRTADICRRLVADGLEDHVRARTGLVVDAYFSGTKLAWLLDSGTGRAQRRRARGAGLRHHRQLPALAPDRRPGARHRRHQCLAHHAVRHCGQRWDRRMLEALRIPEAVLPEVRDCSGEFGVSDPDLFGAAIPILGMAGDQQAASVGQACFKPGMSKSTYGTGCFMLVNTGERPVISGNRLLIDGRLPDGRANHLRARGQHLRRRRRDPMAARRAAGDHLGQRERDACATTSLHGGGLSRPGLHGPWRAPLGSRGPRARSWA